MDLRDVPQQRISTICNPGAWPCVHWRTLVGTLASQQRLLKFVFVCVPPLVTSPCPGMALATMFVTLPFIVRELIPTLEQMDLAQEEAAKTLGANPLQVWWHMRVQGHLYAVQGVPLISAAQVPLSSIVWLWCGKRPAITSEPAQKPGASEPRAVFELCVLHGCCEHDRTDQSLCVLLRPAGVLVPC